MQSSINTLNIRQFFAFAFTFLNIFEAKMSNSQGMSSENCGTSSSDDIVNKEETNSFGVKTQIALPTRVVKTFAPNSSLVNQALSKLNYSNTMFKKLITADDLKLGEKYKVSAIRCVDVKQFSNKSIIVELGNDLEFFLPARYSKVLIDMFYEDERLALKDHTILVENFYMLYKGDAYYADKKTPHLTFQYISDEDDDDNW